ncbi:MAG: glycosyltransferase family 2 protein, partial [Pseudomonadota bacterium]|nr:glycosyltransferase family 2 protein [Pseudomonadota bacterium]
MADIKLSICIPTFNRASYLRTLLASLAEDLHQLPWPVEVIVSDNASPDETAEVVAAMEGQLPLRYMRQSENIGPLRNMQKALRASAGEYAVYLADDDRLAYKGVIRAIEQMDANPKAGIYYAPWLTKDLVTGAYGAPLYQQQGQVTVPQGNYVSLLEHVLDNKVFAEISVVRVAVQKHLTPLANDLAFWAFTMPCEYLGAGDV